MSQRPDRIVYACVQCGKSVLMLGGQPHRQCEHNGAISASLKATVYGEAKVK